MNPPPKFYFAFYLFGRIDIYFDFVIFFVRIVSFRLAGPSSIYKNLRMEEIFNDKHEPAAETITDSPERTKRNWKVWLGTDEAIRQVYLVFGLFAIVLLMALLQFSTTAICCGDWDGYYHIKWSSLLWENFRQGRWLPEFVWLPLTVLNSQDYADHHFVFHLLQIPFLWFFEPVTAAKMAAVVFGSLAVFSVYWLMFYYKIEYLILWLLALLTCASSFFFRINMAKAPPLTIIYTIAGIYLLFERKYVWLLPLMFVFVWTYSLFPMLFIAALIWAIIIGWNERKLEWQPIAYTVGGMILGNIINPYFPQNLRLLGEHFFTKFKVGSDFAVSVGGEWYPFSGMELLTHLPVALVAMLIGYILFAPKNGKLPEKATFFLMFVTILLAAQFRSKRFAEYFPPFAILFAAFSWKEFFAPRVELPEDFKRDIEPYLDQEKKTVRQETYDTLKQVGIWSLGIILSIWMIYNLTGIDTTNWVSEERKNTVGLRALFSLKEDGLLSNIRGNEANDKYSRAMSWANENIPEGERIYNCNWDNFPKMFFYDTKHSYVWGLDTNYLYSKNPELYKLADEINSGKVNDPAPIIREKFGSRFIFSDAKDNENFMAKCLESGWCETAYEDDEAIFLKIRDQKGDAPEESNEDAPPTPEELKQLEEEEKKDDANANVKQNINDEDEEN